MNMGYINTMAVNLVASYWHAHKTKIAASSVRDNLPEIVKLALRAEKDDSSAVREAATKLVEVLKAEGVAIDDSQATSPVNPMSTASATGAAASAPAKTIPVQDALMVAQWAEFENVCIDVAGPMAAALARRIRDNNPGATPKTLRAKVLEKMGDESTGKIYSRYRGS